jgi:hypothetical protein
MGKFKLCENSYIHPKPASLLLLLFKPSYAISIPQEKEYLTTSRSLYSMILDIFIFLEQDLG